MNIFTQTNKQINLVTDYYDLKTSYVNLTEGEIFGFSSKSQVDVNYTNVEEISLTHNKGNLMISSYKPSSILF